MSIKNISNELSQHDKNHFQSLRPEKLNIQNLSNLNYKWLQCKIYGKNILIRSYSAVCSYQSQLYVYGGMQILNGILSDFHKINLSNKESFYQWKQLPNNTPKNYPGPRAKHALINYKSKIYLIGGIKTTTMPCNQIHCYDIITSNWTVIEPQGQQMPPLQSFCSTIINDKIIILFGYNGKTTELTNEVIEYNISTNTIRTLFKFTPAKQKLIPFPRSQSNCISDNKNNIYIFGGKTQQMRLNDLWVFDLSTNKYSRIQDKQDFRPNVRSGHTINFYEEKLYIFGGIHEVTWQLDDLHIFNLKTNQWTTLEVDSARKKESNSNRSSEKKKQTLEKITSPPVSPSKKNSKYWYLEPNNPMSPLETKQFQIDYNEKQSSPQNPSKMRDEQKKKKFLQKKTEMLKNFDLSDKEKINFLNIQPTSQAIKNSLDMIGNHNLKNNNTKLIEFGKTTVSKFLEPLQNNSNWILNKRPCARDGHNSILIGNEIIYFGGDRHQMSFNDIYKLNMLIVRKQTQG